ncbi:MAG: hypothetical protein QW746_04810 [Thermoplasmata archaeon]
MILAIPDHDLKYVNFFKKKREIENVISTIKKLSFFIFYDSSLKVCFDSNDENFQTFLNNFMNIYPVKYEEYRDLIPYGYELFFKRSYIFPLDPGIDIASFISNFIEQNKKGFFMIKIERKNIRFSKFIIHILRNKRNLGYREKIIANAIIEKITLPLYKVKIYTSDFGIASMAIDLTTGQALIRKGKKIIMSVKEISYFIHYPLSYNGRRKPW